jgi:hypothetical protein
MNGDPLLTGDLSSYPNVNSSSVPTVWEEDMFTAAEQGIGCAPGPMLRLTKISSPDPSLPGGALNSCADVTPTTLIVENQRQKKAPVPAGVVQQQLSAAEIASVTTGGSFIGGLPATTVGTTVIPQIPGFGVFALAVPGIGTLSAANGGVGVLAFSTNGESAVKGTGSGVDPTSNPASRAATGGVKGFGGNAFVSGGAAVTGGAGVMGTGGAASSISGVRAAAGAGVIGVGGAGAVGPLLVDGGAGVMGGDGVSGGIGVIGKSGPTSFTGFTPWAGRFDGSAQVNGNLWVNGGLYVSYGPKSSVVAHPDGSHRVMYAVEAPESWLEDVGRAQLRQGAARVEVDPDFAAVSGLGDDYHVFLTPEGPSNSLYVTDRTPAGFQVREQGDGTSEISFSYKIVTKRADSRLRRLEPIELPSATGERAAAEPAEPPLGVPASPQQPAGVPPAEPLPGGAIPERPPGWPESVPWPPDILVNHLRR